MTARAWTLALDVGDRLPLSLNDRRHHMVVWRYRRNLRDRVRLAARQARIPRLDAIHVDMTWTPRTKRVRDADNAVATLKSCIDGLRSYPARKRPSGLIEPAYVGVVPDDDPAHVTWTPPAILPPDPDPQRRGRLVLTITERFGAQ